MQFFALDEFPRGDADTECSKEEPSNRGDALRCPNCGSAQSMLTWLPPFRVELELHGREFGDLVFCSNDILVSQRFRQVYYRHSLTGLSGFDPVEVVKIKSRCKIRPQPPMYFRVQPQIGPAVLDLNASGMEWLEQPKCPACWSAIIVRWKRLVLLKDTWKGEDIFRPRGMTGQIMVTQRFKDACEEGGITNAQFVPAEESGHDFYPGKVTGNFRVAQEP